MGVFGLNIFMNKFILLSGKRFWLCSILFAVIMPSKAAGRFGEFVEKLESIPYGLGILIPIFFVFAAIIGLVYDIEDKEKRGYGRCVVLIIFLILYVLVVKFL